jgi:monoamine oxidase
VFSHVGPLREVHDLSGPDGRAAALFGFAPVTNRPAPTADEVITQLVDLFGPEAASPLEVLIADWSSEPDTTPTVVVPGTPDQTYGHPWFARPLADGRLHWAGTETAPVAPGHIEGALAAAERAVAAIASRRGSPLR